jgi:hypothetical protein
MTVLPKRLAWLTKNEWFFLQQSRYFNSFIQHSVVLIFVAVLIVLLVELEKIQLQ